MVEEIVGNFDGRRLRVGVVVARFNSVVTERLDPPPPASC
jgi:6,7-dimethyl-8-ribityllumazine synthase